MCSRSPVCPIRVLIRRLLRAFVRIRCRLATPLLFSRGFRRESRSARRLYSWAVVSRVHLLRVSSNSAHGSEALRSVFLETEVVVEVRGEIGEGPVLVVSAPAILWGKRTANDSREVHRIFSSYCHDLGSDNYRRPEEDIGGSRLIYAPRFRYQQISILIGHIIPTHTCLLDMYFHMMSADTSRYQPPLTSPVSSCLQLP